MAHSSTKALLHQTSSANSVGISARSFFPAECFSSAEAIDRFFFTCRSNHSSVNYRLSLSRGCKSSIKISDSCLAVIDAIWLQTSTERQIYAKLILKFDCELEHPIAFHTHKLFDAHKTHTLSLSLPLSLSLSHSLSLFLWPYPISHIFMQPRIRNVGGTVEFFNQFYFSYYPWSLDTFERWLPNEDC